MLLRINPSFHIIFLLWTSVSGKLFTFEGYWPVQIEKCDNERDDSREKLYEIGKLDKTEFSYDDLSRETIVRIEGDLELFLTVTGVAKLPKITLEHVSRLENSIKYSTKRKLEAYNNWGSQVAVLEVSITIDRSGEITLRNYVYAGSWGSDNCCGAESLITGFSIDV